MLTNEEKEALEKSLQESEEPPPRLMIGGIHVFGMEISPGAWGTLITKHRGAVEGTLIAANSRWLYIVPSGTRTMLAIRISFVLELHVGSQWVQKILVD